MKKLDRIEIPCTYCGKLFGLKPYLAKIPTKHGRFCSAECRSKFSGKIVKEKLTTKIDTNCAQCGKVITVQPYRLLNTENNFCSRSCSTKYQLAKRWASGAMMAIVTCAFCGKEKTVPQWEVNERAKRGQEQFFCNRQCFGSWKSANWSKENNPSWKGGWTKHVERLVMAIPFAVPGRVLEHGTFYRLKQLF